MEAQAQVEALNNCVNFLKTMLKKGGPAPHDYPFFNRILESLADSIEKKRITPDDLEKIYTLFDNDFLQKSGHGQGYSKPFGYAGDFQVIDRIFQKKAHPDYQQWDNFILNHRTADGIRNRKEYFKKLVTTICKTSTLPRIDLLNLASGPGRDLLELYENCEEATNLNTHCVEHDPHAIAYASKLTEEYKHQITYEQGNIYTYSTKDKYDLVWSSGLFDYFDDRSFVAILKKVLTWAKPNAEIIIGNISPAHSLKNYMEILLKWHLHIRTSKDLIRLAEDAGIPSKNIKIGIEEAGIFLFLHIST